MVKEENFGYDIDMEENNVSSPLPPRVPEGIIEEKNKEEVTEIETRGNIPTEEARVEEKQGKKKGWLLWLLIGLVVVVVVGGVIMFGKNGGITKKQVTINYWGLWEEESVIGTAIADFEAEYPNIKINYVKNFPENYRTRLAGRLGKDAETTEVPDIFRIHASWLPMFRDNLAVVPSDINNKIGLENDYYDVYKRDLKIDGGFRAIPLMYDGLALFYNKKLLEAGGIDLPRTWWDLESAAQKLTVTDEEGQIKVAGAALGMTENVDHWSDIVGLMMKQNGVDLATDSEANAAKIANVLSFYTLFANKTKCWQANLPNSTQLFASGNLAFYFGPSWRVFNFGELSPNLDYGVAGVPQLPTLTDVAPEDMENLDDENLTSIAWSSYWVEGVNDKSGKKDEAFLFLEFLSRKENLAKMYESASQIRAFGEISPRKSMTEDMRANKKAAAFVEGAEKAFSGWTNSRTFDDGLNDRMNQYFKDAINSIVLQSNSVEGAMPMLRSGIAQIVNQYSLRK
jgi:ABC-type glycerol-3-phosphate transport system substrate-binding protein